MFTNKVAFYGWHKRVNFRVNKPLKIEGINFATFKYTLPPTVKFLEDEHYNKYITKRGNYSHATAQIMRFGSIILDKLHKKFGLGRKEEHPVFRCFDGMDDFDFQLYTLAEEVINDRDNNKKDPFLYNSFVEIVSEELGDDEVDNVLESLKLLKNYPRISKKRCLEFSSLKKETIRKMHIHLFKVVYSDELLKE